MRLSYSPWCDTQLAWNITISLYTQFKGETGLINGDYLTRSSLTDGIYEFVKSTLIKVQHVYMFSTCLLRMPRIRTIMVSISYYI